MRPRRAFQLGWLVGKAAAHALWSPRPVAGFCIACKSYMLAGPNGSLVINHFPGGRDCPVHVAWRELLRHEPPAAVARGEP